MLMSRCAEFKRSMRLYDLPGVQSIQTMQFGHPVAMVAMWRSGPNMPSAPLLPFLANLWNGPVNAEFAFGLRATLVQFER